eukprot:953719-Amphidinium_carterae.1
MKICDLDASLQGAGKPSRDNHLDLVKPSQERYTQGCTHAVATKTTLGTPPAPEEPPKPYDVPDPPEPPNPQNN